MNKINQTGASRYLAAHYLEIKEEINTLSSDRNFAGVLQAIINYLRVLLTHSQIKAMSHFIRSVGWVYCRGNQYVKYIVENLFVRSFEGIRKRCTPQQWQFLFKKLPQPFKNIYSLQNKNNLIKNQ